DAAQTAAADAVVARAKSIWSGSGDTKSDSDYLAAADIELSNAFLSLVYIQTAWLAKADATWNEKPISWAFNVYDELLKDCFERFAFLDAYYSDPMVVMGIAEMRYAAYRLADIWDELGKARPQLLEFDEPAPWPQLEDTRIDPEIVFRSKA